MYKQGMRQVGNYFNECPMCGAHLDPGEPCDCMVEREERLKKRNSLNYIMNEMLEESEWKQEELRICC